MILSSQNGLDKYLIVTKHEFHGAIKKWMDNHDKNKVSANTKISENQWYSKFRIYIHSIDTRTIKLTNNGFGNRYVAWLTDQGYSNSYVDRCFRIFIAIINKLDIHHDFNRRKLFKQYAKPNRETESYFLTEKEVHQLLKYNPTDQHERVVLKRFIIACFTGCRISEISSLEIINNTTLRYGARKNGRTVEVPFNDVVKPYLENNEYKEDLHHLVTVNSNKLLHKILKDLKWNKKVILYHMRGRRKIKYTLPRWQAITFHDARKFYGKMLLDRDVSLYKVSKLLGHSGIGLTERTYASLSKDKLIEEVADKINTF